MSRTAERAVLPRWTIGAGYGALWSLGIGFVWLPLALIRLLAVRRWQRPGLAAVLVLVPGALLVSLVVAIVRDDPSPSRVVAGAFLVVPWALVLVAACLRWTADDVRAMCRGLADLAVLQGVLVTVGQIAYPRGQAIRLPVTYVLPEDLVLKAPLDAWSLARLAFPDFYNGPVVRTAGIFGNPTWAGALAALAVLVVFCRPRDLVGRSRWTWLWLPVVLGGSGVTLAFAYSRNDVLGLLLGLLSAGVFAVLLRLRPWARTLSLTAGVAAGVAALVIVDVGALFREFNRSRAGSLDARQAIYAQTLAKVHENALLLGSGIKEQGVDLAASLGSHSSYLGLVYRGGWLAFWGLVSFLLALLVLGIVRRSPLTIGITVFVMLWCTAEDLDAGHLVPVGVVLALAAVRRDRPRADAAPEARLAAELVDRYRRRERTSVTWLNHWSALECLDGRAPLAGITMIGLDGNGLRSLLKDAAPRTSADLVMPLVLPRLYGARVAVLGGSVEGLQARVDALTPLLAPGASVVAAADGYAGRPREEGLRTWLERARPDVVLLALGAPLQEQVAVEVMRVTGPRLVATCGGFLDQIEHGSYYPRWAYPLHLNWLVRLWREPRRLWRRYSVAVLVALLRRRALGVQVSSQPGYAVAKRAVEDPAPVGVR